MARTRLNATKANSDKPLAARKPGPRSNEKPATNNTVSSRVVIKKNPRPKQTKKDCIICASGKTGRSYPKLSQEVQACVHFRDTCKLCIEKMLKAKITDHQLQENTLVCPFPDCEAVLEFQIIKKLVKEGVFISWDNALAKHHLASSSNFMACLNPKCGHHFSVEDWKEECQRKKKIFCPYCDFDLCIKCCRPWHTGKGCHSAKDEETINEAAMRAMGAKPCPKCGVQIQKNNGCDHMTCIKCKSDFCWRCLVTFSPRMVHGEGCPHRHPNIANDAGNYWDGPLNQLDFNAAAQEILARQPRVPVLPVPGPPALIPAQEPRGVIVQVHNNADGQQFNGQNVFNNLMRLFGAGN